MAEKMKSKKRKIIEEKTDVELAKERIQQRKLEESSKKKVILTSIKKKNV